MSIGAKIIKKKTASGKATEGEGAVAEAVDKIHPTEKLMR